MLELGRRWQRLKVWLEDNDRALTLIFMFVGSIVAAVWMLLGQPTLWAEKQVETTLQSQAQNVEVNTNKASQPAPAKVETTPQSPARNVEVNTNKASQPAPTKKADTAEFVDKRDAKCLAEHRAELPIFPFEADVEHSCFWNSVKSQLANETSWERKISFELTRPYDRQSQNRREQICDMVYRDNFVPTTLSLNDKVTTLCFEPYLSKHAAILLPPIVGLFAESVTKAAARVGQIPSPNPSTVDIGQNCKTTDRNQIARLARGFRLATVGKALVFAESLGKGETVLTRVKRGLGALDATEDLAIPSQGTNLNPFIELSVDDIIAHFSDVQIVQFGDVAWALLASDQKAELLLAGRELLDFYVQNIRSRRDKVRQIAVEYSSGKFWNEYHETQELNVFFDYTAAGAIECIESQMGLFWLRRIMRGTDKRVFALISEWIPKKELGLQ